MSARDRLLYHLEQHLTVPTARGLVDAFAHELAEKVMALRTNLPDLAARPAWKAGYDAALVMAALTIDPAKESDRG